jgi:hypothetical protein
LKSYSVHSFFLTPLAARSGARWCVL